jgi:hypothetical protein
MSVDYRAFGADGIGVPYAGEVCESNSEYSTEHFDAVMKVAENPAPLYSSSDVQVCLHFLCSPISLPFALQISLFPCRSGC